jgi:hypothetical protein
VPTTVTVTGFSDGRCRGDRSGGRPRCGGPRRHSGRGRGHWSKVSHHPLPQPQPHRAYRRTRHRRDRGSAATPARPFQGHHHGPDAPGRADPGEIDTAGRYDDEGRLRYIDRTTALAQTAALRSSACSLQGRRSRPWTDWSFSAGQGSRETSNLTLVESELVMEIGVDVARDAPGRWRHPARRHRLRPGFSSTDVSRPTSPPH